MLEIITSLLEAVSGYIGGRFFKNRKYTRKKIFLISFFVSAIFFLVYSCYELLFGQKEFIKITFLISLMLFIAISLILFILKVINYFLNNGYNDWHKHKQGNDK